MRKLNPPLRPQRYDPCKNYRHCVFSCIAVNIECRDGAELPSDQVKCGRQFSAFILIAWYGKHARLLSLVTLETSVDVSGA